MADERQKGFFCSLQKKGSPILIGLLTGLLLLVVAWPDGSRKKTTEHDAVTVQGSRADTQQQSADQRAKALERRLENVLSQVQGVGNVTVMITLRTQGEQKYPGCGQQRKKQCGRIRAGRKYGL